MNGKSILITGCSSGIGHYVAIALKERGYRVFATARKEADVAALKAQGLESFQLDVNDTASMQKALAHILQLTNGTLDALFNNSGFLQTGAIEDLSREMNRKQFETNVFGPMELIRLIMPIMRKQGHGRIIQNSSILGVVTIPYCGAYNASKFALEGFSNTLRQELRGTDIHVSIINPGPIESKLRAHAHEHYQPITIEKSAHKEAYQKLEASYFNRNDNGGKFTNSPEPVVKKIVHALESKRPRAHYFIGFAAQALAFTRRILPDKALDWVLIKARG